MKKMLKYFIFGISCVIPGLCSATTAILLKIYDELLDSIVNVFKIKNWKQYGGIYCFIFLGSIVGIFCLKNLYYLFPFLLNIIFLGIVLRSFPISVNYGNNLMKNKIIFIVGFLIVLLLSFINKQIFVIDYQNINLKFFLLVSLNGIIVSLAMILPGISGALMLVSFGLYFPLLNGISNIFDFNNFILVITFIVSFSIGLICFSLILKKIMNKESALFNYLINGMILGTIITIILELPLLSYNLFEVIIGMIMMILIYLIPFKNKLVSF